MAASLDLLCPPRPRQPGRRRPRPAAGVIPAALCGAVAMVLLLVGAASATTCGPGYYDSSGTCTMCPVITYKPGTDARTSCFPCPDNMVCPTNGLKYPLTVLGQWTDSANPLLVYRCSPEDSCPYLSQPNECAKGYSGAFCSICAEGYYRLNGYCYPCLPDYGVFEKVQGYGIALMLFEKGIILVQVVVFSMFFIIPAVLIFYRLALKKSFDNKYDSMVTAGNKGLFLVTQVLFAAQTTSVIFMFDIQWPFFIDMFKFVSLSVRDGPLWLSARGTTRTCYEDIDSVSEINNTYIWRAAGFCGMCLSFFGVLIVVVALVNVWERAMKGRQKMKKSYDAFIRKNMKRDEKGGIVNKTTHLHSGVGFCTPTDIVLQFTFRMAAALYLSIHERAMSTFSCVEITDSNHERSISVLSQYPSIECYSGDWSNVMIWTSITVALISIGLPCAYMTTLFIAHRRRHIPWVQKRLGFLWNIYDDKLYYFELLTFIYKFMLGCVHLIRFRGVTAQVVYALFLTILYFSVTTRTSPYLARRHDMLAFFSLMSMLWCCLLALTYFDRNQVQTAYDLLTSPVETTFLAVATLFILWTNMVYVYVGFVDTAKFWVGDEENTAAPRRRKGKLKSIEETLESREKQRLLKDVASLLEPKYADLVKDLAKMETKMSWLSDEVGQESIKNSFESIRNTVINIKNFKELQKDQQRLVEMAREHTKRENEADENEENDAEKPKGSEGDAGGHKDVVATATAGMVNNEFALKKTIKLNQTDHTLNNKDGVTFVDRTGMRYFRETNRGVGYFNSDGSRAEEQDLVALAAEKEKMARLVAADKKAAAEAREQQENAALTASTAQEKEKDKEVEDDVKPFIVIKRGGVNDNNKVGKAYVVAHITDAPLKSTFSEDVAANGYTPPAAPSIEVTRPIFEPSMLDESARFKSAPRDHVEFKTQFGRKKKERQEAALAKMKHNEVFDDLV